YHITGMDDHPTDIAELVNGNRVKIHKAGQVKIVASQAGDGVYTAAVPVTQVLTIKPRQVTAIAAPAAVEVAFGTEFAAISKPGTVQVTFSDGQTVALPVTWAPGNYNGRQLGVYQSEGSLY